MDGWDFKLYLFFAVARHGVNAFRTIQLFKFSYSESEKGGSDAGS